MNLAKRTERRRLPNMRWPGCMRACSMVCSLMVVSRPAPGRTRQNPDASNISDRPFPAPRDGQHDFDFEIGTWKAHLRRLLHPLTSSKTWVEYGGRTVVREVCNGRANLAELEAHGSAGPSEGLNPRLYNPQSRQSNLNFISDITPDSCRWEQAFSDDRGRT
jgi:hypothetical protein